MRFLPTIVALIFCLGPVLRATDLPTVKAAIPDIETAQSSPISAIDLRNHFEITGIQGQVVQFRTSLGSFNVEMLPAAAPVSVANFLSYVNGNRYANTFIHRSDQGLGVIQGGGYAITNPSPLSLARIATDPPIVLEYNLPNTRGTIAMARTSALNSATSEWFINTVDNTFTLGAANNGGYAVFGRVTGTGMTVVDAIHALQVWAFSSPYGQLPLIGYSGTGSVLPANFVMMNGNEAVPIFPAAAGQNAVVSFSVTGNTNPTLVTAGVSGSMLNLTLSPAASGVAELTVKAADTNGNAVENTFRVTVTGSDPEIVVEQPEGSGLADGGSRVFPLINVGGTANFVFTIKNVGGGALALTGSPRVQVTGANAGQFSVTVQPAAIVTTGGSTTFTVRFAPTSGGLKSAVLHIANNDADENPFDIQISGVANARPMLSLPQSPVFAEPASAGGAIVTFSVTANDAEDGPLTPTVTPPSGSLFPVGNTTVTVSATDSKGATTSSSFVVNVSIPRAAGTALIAGARSGDPAPGAGAGALPSSAVLSAFGPPALSDFRKMAARVTMLAGPAKMTGVLIEEKSGTRTLAAAQGGPVPGISTAGVAFKSFVDPVIAPDGAVAFAGVVQGGGVKATEDSGVWTDAFGSSLELVLREGRDVPGLPAGAKLKAAPSLSVRNGELLALLTLNAAKNVVTAADDTVLLRMTAADTATVLLRKGRELDGLPGSKIKSFSVLSPALGSPGHGRWHADGGTLAKVVLFDGRTLLVKIAPGGAVTPLLSTADAATPVNTAARWKAFGLPVASSGGGRFAVAATLQPGVGGVLASNDTALLFSGDGAAWNVFAREGGTAPLISAGASYASFFDPLVNDAGHVAFLATLQGTGVTGANKTALFSGPPNALKGVARLGSPAPNEAGAATSAVWSKFISFALPGGPDAGVIFLAETSGGDTTAKNKLALWAVDSQGVVRRLLRIGNSVGDGTSPVTGLTLLNAVPGAPGATRSFNATGSIALVATCADKTQRLLRVDIP